MFSNPFTAVMALILLAFVGTLIIFFCIWRELDALRRTVQDMRSSMQFVALDMEQHTRDLAAILRELRQLTDNGNVDLGVMLENGLPNLEGKFVSEMPGCRTDAPNAGLMASASLAQSSPHGPFDKSGFSADIPEGASLMHGQSAVLDDQIHNAAFDDSLAPLRFSDAEEEEALFDAIRGVRPKP